MDIRLERIRSEFWDWQTTVLPEEGVIAKILRQIERVKSNGMSILLTAEQQETFNTYECIGFFEAHMYPTVMIAIPIGPAPGEELGRVIASKPEADVRYHKVGQAQLWYSTTSKICVLWECLSFEGMRTMGPKKVSPRARDLWIWLLKYIEYLGMREVYAHDRDSDYDDESYLELLTFLGFERIKERTMRKCMEKIC